MKKMLFFLLLCTAASTGFNSCKNLTDTIPERNTEKLIYKKNNDNSEAIKNPNSINIQDRILSTYLINYQNDYLRTLRSNDKWNKYIEDNHFVIDEKNVKKTNVVDSKIVMITIPYASKMENGFLNVYQNNHVYIWTKVEINQVTNNVKHYNFTNSRNELIMRFDLDNKFNLSKFEVSIDKNVMQKSPDFQSFNTESFKANKTALIDPGDGDGGGGGGGGGGGEDCFKKGISYYKCLECIIIKHCGSDLVCTIACTIAPEVCLGVAVLACLPVI
ncbi:hypothetical protein VRU48_14785 [Pedobacter sp. KR3-3]|uniref:Lipoprotein n=1 Tax=Pedobacter albus TaxID=3113905 RepID=A0ABU7IA94_9SPHI|nr:hypothetical protein [Pedobacter sp. KR3-3]MEE1946388.1 hypothetical protein [Pedobacter sp. KR3-3]